MKIAMLGHKRFPSREGGIEVVVNELSSRMVAQGHSVTVFNRRGTNCHEDEYQYGQECREIIRENSKPAKLESESEFHPIEESKEFEPGESKPAKLESESEFHPIEESKEFEPGESKPAKLEFRSNFHSPEESKESMLEGNNQAINDSKSQSIRAKEHQGVKIEEVFTINRRGYAAVTSSFFACVRAGFGKYDVVHIHAEGPAFFSFIPKWFGKKVVVTIHGLDWDRSKWGKFSSWFIKLGEKNAVKYADEIIVLSHSMQNFFQKEYKRETKYIPNGVNKPDTRNIEEIQKWGLEKDNYILFVGRIVPEKGEHYLINAFKKINTDKKLVIVGGTSDTGPYGKYLKELAANDDRIIFTGFVQGKKLEELFSNCYIYCLPSDLEGMSLSLLEAMSYGNCCIVSDIDECVEVVEDKAVIFKRGNEEDLREKLEWLVNNNDIVKQYKNMSADFICSKYSWDDVLSKTLELYK